MTKAKTIATLQTPFQMLEAPIDDGAGRLVVSDIVGGGVYRVSAEGSIETVVGKRRGVGGIAKHVNGGYVVSGRDVVHVNGGQSRVLLSRADVETVASRDGEAVGGFNDLICGPEGELYVGTTRFHRDGSRAPGDLLRLGLLGECSVCFADLGLANGIALSPTDDLIFQADTDRRRIVVIPGPSSTGHAVGEFSTTATPGYPDGIAVDDSGAIWIAFYQGSCVAQYSPSGQELQRIELPVSDILSLCFTGDQRDELVVVTGAQPKDAGNAAIYRLWPGACGIPLYKCLV